MILYIIRHAIAEPLKEGASPESDSQRSLTTKGRKKMRSIARGLSRLKAPIEVILTSPYVRTVETARILAKGLALGKDKIAQTEELAPAGDPGRLMKEITSKFGGMQTIALVGHEPYLSRLISVLLSGTPGLAIILKKGGVCRLSIEKLEYGRCALLEWLMAPAQLRRISG